MKHLFYTACVLILLSVVATGAHALNKQLTQPFEQSGRIFYGVQIPDMGFDNTDNH